MVKPKVAEFNEEALKIQREKNFVIYKEKLTEIRLEVKALEAKKASINTWIDEQLGNKLNQLKQEIETYKVKNIELKKLFSENDKIRSNLNSKTNEAIKIYEENKIEIQKLREEYDNKHKRLVSEQREIKEKESYFDECDKSLKKQSEAVKKHNKVLNDEYRYIEIERKKNSETLHEVKAEKEKVSKDKESLEKTHSELLKQKEILDHRENTLRETEKKLSALERRHITDLDNILIDKKKLSLELASLNEIKIKYQNDSRLLQEKQRELKSWETRLNNREGNIQEKERLAVKS